MKKSQYKLEFETAYATVAAKMDTLEFKEMSGKVQKKAWRRDRETVKWMKKIAQVQVARVMIEPWWVRACGQYAQLREMRKFKPKKVLALRILEVNPKYEYQGPRYISIGPNSGEEFREDVLIPWLKNLHISGYEFHEAYINFCGTHTYNPAFLHEAFGGAIKKGYDVLFNVELIGIPREERARIGKYMREARDERDEKKTVNRAVEHGF